MALSHLLLIAPLVIAGAIPEPSPSDIHSSKPRSTIRGRSKLFHGTRCCWLPRGTDRVRLLAQRISTTRLRTATRIDDTMTSLEAETEPMQPKDLAARSQSEPGPVRRASKPVLSTCLSVVVVGVAGALYLLVNSTDHKPLCLKRPAPCRWQEEGPDCEHRIKPCRVSGHAEEAPAKSIDPYVEGEVTVTFNSREDECFEISLQPGECWGHNDRNGGNYDCMGRCGAACSSGLYCSNWDVKCLSHDVCSWYFSSSGGVFDPNCGDEAWEAIPALFYPCAVGPHPGLCDSTEGQICGCHAADAI